MRHITAWIKPEKLNDVVYALHETPGLRGLSVTEGRGFGRARLQESARQVQREPDNFRPHVRLELLCADAAADALVEVICAQGRTGHGGDGLVVCSPTGACRSVCTGEPVDYDRD